MKKGARVRVTLILENIHLMSKRLSLILKTTNAIRKKLQQQIITTVGVSEITWAWFAP